MKQVKILLLTISIAFISNVNAQAYFPIEDVDVLKKHTLILEEKYPGLVNQKIVSEVYNIDEDHTRIVYNDNGVHKEEIVYSPEGKMIIIASLTKIAEDAVPNIVRDAYREDADERNKVTSYFEVSPTYGGGIYYGIEFTKDDDIQRVYYSDLGVPKQAPR